MKFQHLAYGHAINFHTTKPDTLRLAHQVFGLVCSQYPLSLESRESALELASNVTSRLAGVTPDLATTVAPLVAHEIELSRARDSVFHLSMADLKAQGRTDVGALQAALWFLVKMEPSEEEEVEEGDNELEQKYASRVELAREDIASAKSIVRAFAESLTDKSLPGMQAAYYGITNTSWWLNQGAIALSVITSEMSSEWDGIGAWRK